MKKFRYGLILLIFTVMVAQGYPTKKIFKNLRPSTLPSDKYQGSVSYVHFSNSINGPFSSPQTIATTDSLFIRMDVTPGGNVFAEYILDVNENGIVDDGEPSFGTDTYHDNSSIGPIDLDPTPGIILSYIDPEQIPSMQVIVRAREGSTEATGVIIFENPPADYILSGNVFSDTGDPIAGALVWAMDSLSFQGDVSDTSGFYYIPLNAGVYKIRIEDLWGRYSSFDTLLEITGNTTQNFYLNLLTSYIRGYVRDENNNPIPHVRVWLESENYRTSTETDSLGHYMVYVSSGVGRIGLSPESLQPRYLVPRVHEYFITENDSIVDNDTSNFICFTTNASITGSVRENGQIPTRQYVIGGWTTNLNSYTQTTSALSGEYSLPIHHYEPQPPTYDVWLREDDERFPLPPELYPDTMYWGLTAGLFADFNLVYAETAYVDGFDGDMLPPPPFWEYYSFNAPWGNSTRVGIINNRLMIQCESQSGTSGVGVVGRKPFKVNNREFNIELDLSAVGNDNKVSILLSDMKRVWAHPNDIPNWVQLLWFDHGVNDRGWQLLQSNNYTVSTLWQSNNPTGSRVIIQFNSLTHFVNLLIDGELKYSGPWGEHIQKAYVYLSEWNTNPNPPTPVYVNFFSASDIGTTGVREISGVTPTQFKLEQNFPNPFNPATNIRFEIPQAGYVTLKVYNTLGQEIAVLVDQEMGSGKFETTLDASRLASGVYYYRLVVSPAAGGIEPLTAGSFSDMKKLVVVK